MSYTPLGVRLNVQFLQDPTVLSKRVPYWEEIWLPGALLDRQLGNVVRLAFNYSWCDEF
jgi:hypothetical protein